MEKKPWSEPILVELARGGPQEAVLLTCRLATPGTPVAPGTVGTQCICPTNGECAQCQTLSES
jgi:hypothetical protein